VHNERQVLLGIFHADPSLLADRPGQVLIGDKNHYGRDFEAALARAEVRLLRPAGVLVRVLQRVLALTAAIWHNDRTGQPVKRSLVAYDN